MPRGGDEQLSADTFWHQDGTKVGQQVHAAQFVKMDNRTRIANNLDRAIPRHAGPIRRLPECTVPSTLPVRIQEAAQGICYQIIHVLKPPFRDQRLQLDK
jgi:hypothetical protein